MVNVLQYCKIHLFADDAVIYYAEKNQYAAQDCINVDIKNLTSWLYNNKLKLNINKTKMMLVGNSNIKSDWLRNNFTIKMEGIDIELVEKIKYLGVIVDSKLNSSEHIEYLCKKISKKLGFLYRISSYLSKWTRLTVYNNTDIASLSILQYSDICE